MTVYTISNPDRREHTRLECTTAIVWRHVWRPEWCRTASWDVETTTASYKPVWGHRRDLSWIVYSRMLLSQRLRPQDQPYAIESAIVSIR